MGIIGIPDPVKDNGFAVKKFIKIGEKYYAEIQPLQKTYRIRISPYDYQKALIAQYKSKKIYCYPHEGILEDDTFEEVVYQMIIE